MSASSWTEACLWAETVAPATAMRASMAQNRKPADNSARLPPADPFTTGSGSLLFVTNGRRIQHFVYLLQKRVRGKWLAQKRGAGLQNAVPVNDVFRVAGNV